MDEKLKNEYILYKYTKCCFTSYIYYVDKYLNTLNYLPNLNVIISIIILL